jgi:hypothetical protein
MRLVKLDWAALTEAAAGMGVCGREAIVQHLGVEPEPVTMEVIARVVTLFPARAVDVFRISGRGDLLPPPPPTLGLRGQRARR